MKRTTAQDKAEFRAYCKGCTDSQLQNVYNKERAARRMVYAEIAQNEIARRGLGA